MGLLDRLFRPRDDAALALYDAIVAKGRAPHWYLDGQVPDTVDGRFDMIASVLSVVLIRLEREPASAALQARLTERFVEDMDGQLRELGIGDVVVGKHVGRMMSMLGGRIGAYRTGLAEGTLGEALVRNLWRGTAPDDAAVAHVERALRSLDADLATVPLEGLEQGMLP